MTSARCRPRTVGNDVAIKYRPAGRRLVSSDILERTAEDPGMSIVRLAAAIALTIALVGCGTAQDKFAQPSSGYLVNAADYVGKADWSKAETIVVTLDEYAFQPSSLSFKAGQPYMLHLVNRGKSNHTFTSENFFKSIAVQKLVESGTTVNAPVLHSIGMPPGTSKDLYFVPVTPGDYKFECSEPLHSTFGMNGGITITGG
jgi:uncharacterized cupredoxin-like copper-binding protein